MSEYISHEQYTDMLKNFGKSTPKGLLKENLEKEGNAFTAGLAKTPKGGKFKVGNKQFKDKTNYDAPIKEDGSEIEKLKQDIKTEYGHGGSILSFANSDSLARIAKVSPRAAKALEAMDNMMPEDLDIADLKPALRAKVEKIESSILSELGIDINSLDETDMGSEGVKVIGDLGGDVYRIRTVEGDEVELEFDQDKGEAVDPPYGYEGTLSAEHGDYEYVIPAAFISMGGGSFEVEPRLDRIDAYPLKRGGMKEYQFDQMYPDDPGPFEGREDVCPVCKQDPCVCNMKEGLNLPSKGMQATSAMVQTVKEDGQNAAYNFSVLSPSEKDRLREYINSIKTIKEEINKLVNKAKSSGAMMESGKVEVKPNPAVATAHKTAAAKDHKAKPGGNRTGLVMPKGEVWENEDTAANVNPKIQTILSKLIDSLKAEGLSEHDIKMFIDHEIEEKGKEAVASQYDF
jgi:hypothetical protein